MGAEPQRAGCHGARLDSAEPLPIDVGSFRGHPLTTLAVEIIDGGELHGTVGQRELWRLPGVAEAGGPARRQAEISMHAAGGGAHFLRVGADPVVRIASDHRTIELAAPLDPVRAQLLVSFAVPLVLERSGVLTLHGAAAARDGQAVVLCGPGGAGKSSALVGLMDRGWQPISEDVCVIDLPGDAPVIWPGPPWVRCLHGEPGPAGAVTLFRSSEKTAWTLRPALVADAVPVVAVVFLDRPGGQAVELEPITDPGARVGQLAQHAVWLGEPAERIRGLFGPVAALAHRVRAARLRVPRSQRWVDELAAALDAQLAPRPFRG